MFLICVTFKALEENCSLFPICVDHDDDQYDVKNGLSYDTNIQQYKKKSIDDPYLSEEKKIA